MTVACYVRVSTEEQNLDRQLKATRDYAEDLGATLGDLEIYRDKSTGTTSRSASCASWRMLDTGVSR